MTYITPSVLCRGTLSWLIHIQLDQFLLGLCFTVFLQEVEAKFSSRLEAVCRLMVKKEHWRQMKARIKTIEILYMGERETGFLGSEGMIEVKFLLFMGGQEAPSVWFCPHMELFKRVNFNKGRIDSVCLKRRCLTAIFSF